MATVIELKDLSIRKIIKSGRYSFGRGHYGLYLEADVDSNGFLSKKWGQKIYIKGKGNGGKAKPKELGLGTYPQVGVASALKDAESHAALAAQGIDPRAHAAKIPVFKTVAMELVEENSSRRDDDDTKTWSKNYTKRMTQILTVHCFPFIGDRRVDQITKFDLSFLISLPTRSPWSATFLISFMTKVFDRCVFNDFMDANPIDGSFKSQIQRNGRETKHFPALLQNELPDVIAAIDRCTNIDIAVRSGLKSMMVTGVRPHSMEMAEWSEIQWKEIRDEDDWNINDWEPVDWDRVDDSTKTIIWRIPVEHMKKEKLSMSQYRDNSLTF